MVKLLSVVVSVYNEELALREFYQETGAVLKALPSSWDYELLFVNDGSADRSLEILRELARRDDRVRVVEFSRNFGHEAAESRLVRPGETASSAWTQTSSIRRSAFWRSWKNLTRAMKSSVWSA